MVWKGVHKPKGVTYWCLLVRLLSLVPFEGPQRANITAFVYVYFWTFWNVPWLVIAPPSPRLLGIQVMFLK